MNRRELLEQALRKHGIVEPARLDSHVRGCDLALPVTEELLQIDSLFSVWVRDGGVPGKYGSPVGVDPTRLGIMIEGRHEQVFKVTKPTAVIRCTAATFPFGLADRVGGWGGGIQYLLSPDWQRFVERIR